MLRRLVALTLLSLACVPDPAPAEADAEAPLDAAEADAGEPDAAEADAEAPLDAAEADAEAPLDAAEADAEAPLDAAEVDAGEPDAAPVDAGERLDAAEADAGAPPDAAEGDAWSDVDGEADAGGGLDAGGGDAHALDAQAADGAGGVDAGWGGCSVLGTPGVCLAVSDCQGTATPGYCPGPSEIQCCTAGPPTAGCDAAELRRDVNAGRLVEVGFDPSCPPGMLRVEGFCVDKFEAALVELGAGGVEEPWSPFHHPGSRTVRAVSAEGAVPQGYVDQRVAGRACAAAGKRLCTDAEWLRACRGPGQTTYPYGNTDRPGTCNEDRPRHPAVELFPNAPNPFALIQNACISQLPDTVAPAGGFPGCVTAEGAFDMMGNLHEWTADPAGTFRGGFYVDTYRNGEGCLYRTTAHDVGHWDYSTGFRCCADPL